MAGYYYAVAALPSLFLDSDPPIEWDELLAFLRRQLTPADMRMLPGANLEEPAVKVVLDAARSFEVSEEEQGSAERGETNLAELDEPVEELSPSAAEFRSFDRALRNALVHARSDNAERVNKSVRSGDPGYAARAEEVAREAINSDPLEAERYLDKVRFDFLSELEVGHHFDFENIVIYCLKLQIITLRSTRTYEAGREVFERSYNAVLEKLGDITSI